MKKLKAFIKKTKHLIDMLILFGENISKLRQLVSILLVFAEDRSDFLVEQNIKLKNELELSKKGIKFLQERISEYRLSFQDTERDFRQNFIQEFPAVWPTETVKEKILPEIPKEGIL